MPSIEDIHPRLAQALPQVRIVRDVMAGRRAIQSKRQAYLRPTRPGQSPEEYDTLLDNTSWFPATSRTAQGKRGLMFAKNVVLNGPALEPIKQVITRAGDSIRDMAEEVVWETLQTNFTGLLADHPPRPEGVELNAENALQLNYRPFVHVYPLESILWIDYQVRGPVRAFERVVVRETCDRVLELMLVQGTYVQRVWERPSVGGALEVTETRTPTMDGAPLSQIPFTIVSNNTQAWPQPSVLHELADLNLDHYKINGRIAAIHLYASGMAAVLSGVKFDKDERGDPKTPQLFTGPGGFICFEDPQARGTFLEPRGDTLDGLLKSRDDLQEQMAKVGGNLIASDRNKAPESDNNAIRRDAAENSATASLADVYGRRISAALTWCSRWLGGGPATYTLNQDYHMAGMSAQERQVALAELQSGARSWEDYFYERRDRGVVNASLTPEAERARIDQDIADRPPTDAL